MATNVQSECVRRARHVGVTMLAAGAVLGASIVTAPAATAQTQPLTTVRCGQVLTSSVQVANDLTDCPNDGLVAGADDITIDLGGRTLDGVGLGAGIRVDGRSGVAVAGGTVRDFDHGVLMGPGTRTTTVSDLTLADNQEAGVLLAGTGTGNQVLESSFTLNALAVGLVDGTEGASVAGNAVGEGGGHGFLISHAAGNRLERNSVSGGSDAGIVLESASHNVLRGNLVTGVSDAAVLLEVESDGNIVDANELTDSDGGIILDRSTGNILTGNSIHGMSDNGVDLEGSHDSVVMHNDLRFNGEGLALFDATGNWIEANETSSSGGTAIILEGAATGNVLLNNTANDNGAGGISAITLGEPGHGNLISGNTASRNQGSGIEVSGVGDTLRSNVADGNSAWGITTTAASDGGGNLATGNGEPAQCSGIICNGDPPAESDTEPPTTRITDHPLHPSAVTYAVFAFAAGDEDHVRFECSLDGSTFSACTSPTTYTGLSLGWHAFTVRSIDAAGNVDPAPAGHSWSIEETPPVDCGSAVTLLADTDAWLDQNSATTNKGDDSALKIRSKGPSDNFRTVVRFPLPPKPDGCAVEAAELSLYSSGGAPNRTLQALRITAPWSEGTVTWSTQPPATGPAAATSSGEGWRHWAVKGLVRDMYDTRAAHGFLLRDAIEGADAEQGFSTRESEEGPRLVVRFVPIVVDTTAPQTAITSSPAETTTDTTATFEFAADEPGSSFTCTLDGNRPEPCTSPQHYTGLTVGEHTFTVTATDPAGNTDPTPASRTWTVEELPPPPDTTPPVVTISSGPDDPTTDTEATFTFTVDDPTATVTCTLDGGRPEPCTSPHGYSGLIPGVRTLTVTATDPAGNTGTALWAWAIQEPPPPPPPDTTPPVVTISSGPDDPTTDTEATFTFTVDDPTATVTCTLDGGRPEPCTSPHGYSGLIPGVHTLTVTATDPAGNTGTATRTWTVEEPAPPPDTTPPETTITAGPAETTTDTTATFEFAADEPGSSFTCTLDGNRPEPCTSPQRYTGLTVGVHTLTVSATDPAGNTDPTPALQVWTVEAPPPPPDCGATLTLTSTADAWLDQNSSTANKGSDAIISVRSKQPRDNFRSLVRFTLPAVPTGCAVESATLRLYAAAHSAGRTVQAYRVTSAWAESTVTWATQPTTTGPAVSSPSGPGWREWSVGPQVQAMIDSSAPHGFLLRDAVESIDHEQQFHAREKGENVPQLVITYGAAS